MIGKLLDKWIIKGTDQLNSDSFLHYHNINLNISTFNESIFNESKFKMSSGKVDELKLNVNWHEVFRYWTEIRATDCGE